MQCGFWISKKKKRCKQSIMNGSKFCRFHIPTKEAKEIFDREACEYCKCLILCKKMDTHLQTLCPVLKKNRMIESQVFYHKNIHYYGDGRTINNDNCNAISTKSMITEEFMNKIHSLMMSNTIEFTPILDGKIETFQEIRDIYCTVHRNKDNLKHCLQIESLIYHMENYINSDCLLLELGAGKAGLGCALHTYCHQPLLMIDVCRVLRHKEENRLNSEHITRVQCGLQHFSLSKYFKQKNTINLKNMQIIAFSKHLCGAATDFGLRCMIQENITNYCNMIAIAFCCRGKCTFETYCNTIYLREQLMSKSNAEFEQEWNWIRRMSTWEIDCKVDDQSFKYGKRSHIGIFCRRLIDEGRVQYLKMHGFTDVKLYEYCKKSVTKENILMIAIHSKEIRQNYFANTCEII